MKKIQIATASLVVLMFAVSAFAQKTMTIPEGTQIRLKLMQTVSSGSAKSGDDINFQVYEDVVVNGHVVIAAGASATGTVTAAQKKGMMGRGGKIEFNIDRVRKIDGQYIVINKPVVREGDGHEGKMIAVGMVVGVAGLAIRGKNADVLEGATFKVYTDSDKTVTIK